MSGEFTPGPWGVGFRSAVRAVTGACGEWIAILPNGRREGFGVVDDFEIDANARLIAAAPDLLTACSDWIDWLKPDAPWRDDAREHEERMLDAMRAAIAKAKGESSKADSQGER